MVTVAIIGNPNVGKTELFNKLTGLKQHVGNWPGVTVEKKEGRYVYKGEKINVIDLPGTYSLTAYSIDELIARNFIIEGKPDVVVDIIDATNLERNLYLTFLLLELGANVVIALNMWDVARGRDIKIDVKKLEKLLDVPVVPTVATTGEGIDKLKEEISKAIEKRRSRATLRYGEEIEDFIEKVEEILKEDEELIKKYPLRWLAIKILERDEEILKKLEGKPYKNKVDEILKNAGEIEEKIVEERYEIISEIIKEVVKEKKEKWTFSDMLDQVFLHRILGIPIFLALLYAMFQFTFSFSAPFSDMIDMFFAWLGEIARENISNPMLASFLADGICAGLGAVLVFVPTIFALFFALALLEDSGYLARAAFLMDKIMYKLGLHGKSSIPMLIGFGCNIPAIMAARTIENEKDRIITIMINPLMSCSARLPVYVLIASIIFGGYAAVAIFSMYLLGIALAIIVALLLRKTLFKGKPSPFILELPRYMLPTLRSALLHMWERGKWFLIKAGTFIFTVVILIWFLSAFPWDATNGGELIENSYIASFGHAIEPIFKPLGWNWQAGVALFFGFLAKEAVVGTFGSLLGVSEEGVKNALMNAGWFTPLTGFAYMAFVLIYFPCVATIAVMLREMKAKYTLLTIAYTITLAFIVAGLIEGIGYLLGFS